MHMRTYNDYSIATRVYCIPLICLFGVTIYIPGITRRRALYCNLNPNAIGVVCTVMRRHLTVDGTGTVFICVHVTRSVGIERMLVHTVYYSKSIFTE